VQGAPLLEPLLPLPPLLPPLPLELPPGAELEATQVPRPASRANTQV
jgi:hypothetical protein